jgi:GT2 family glycosyltransferase
MTAASPGSGGGVEVEVIVPIYNAVEALERCLAALASRLPDWAGLQLVDDASPDPRVQALLARVAPTLPARTRVLRQSTNLGFVGTVNAAIGRARGDVVLLNADTVVSRGWLDRLRDCMASDPRIASATPLSNNAEIASFPHTLVANPVPPDPDAIAAAAAGLAPTYPDIPTAVGFCVWLRRRALDSVGLFDQATFGRGYGEENDWCMRAAGHGWRHVLCDGAYVVHQGGASFAAEGILPNGDQLARLVGRYPHYNALIADFIQRDPLAPLRRALADRLGPAGA